MIYRIKILKGLLHPKRSLFQLEKAEDIYGLSWRIFLLTLASSLIFTFSGFNGIGSHVFSNELAQSPGNEYEWLKSYFVFGRFILGALFSAIIVYFTSLWFWTLTDVPYTKLIVLQIWVLAVLLLEQIFLTGMAVQWDLPWYSSPLSLGVIAQYSINKKFVIYLLGSFSLFKIWAMSLQYKGLRALTNKSRAFTLLIVFGIHFLYWLTTALLAYLDFKVLL